MPNVATVRSSCFECFFHLVCSLVHSKGISIFVEWRKQFKIRIMKRYETRIEERREKKKKQISTDDTKPRFHITTTTYKCTLRSRCSSEKSRKFLFINLVRPFVWWWEACLDAYSVIQYFVGIKRTEGFDEKLARAALEIDPEKQLELLIEAEELAYEDCMYVPLWTNPSINLHVPEFKDTVWFVGKPNVHFERAWFEK